MTVTVSISFSTVRRSIEAVILPDGDIISEAKLSVEGNTMNAKKVHIKIEKENRIITIERKEKYIAFLLLQKF